jgi:hypothetical protein
MGCILIISVYSNSLYILVIQLASRFQWEIGNFSYITKLYVNKIRLKWSRKLQPDVY